MDSTGTAGGSGDVAVREVLGDLRQRRRHDRGAPGDRPGQRPQPARRRGPRRRRRAEPEPSEIQGLIASAIGIDAKRGDTVQVSTLPFDRSAEKAAKATSSAAAKKADASAQQMTLIRNSGLAVVLIALILLLAWIKGRKTREGARRGDVVRRRAAAPGGPGAGRAAGACRWRPSRRQCSRWSRPSSSEADEMRDELAALVERQPEDVAALLRGWLVERP